MTSWLSWSVILLFGMMPVMVARTTPQDHQVPKLRVGDADVDGSFIQPYTSTFKLTRKSADGKISEAGRWTSDVKIVERGGKKLLRTQVVKYSKDGAKEFERLHLTDQKTLAPHVLHQTVGGQTTYHLDITGSKIRLTALLTAEAPPLTGESVLEEAPFDLSLFGLLLASFPLRQGYKADFPIFGQASTSSPSFLLAWETMSVGAKEKVQVGEREVEAWPVTTTLRPWTVWVTKEAPYEVKIVQRLSDGSEMVSEIVK